MAATVAPEEAGPDPALSRGIVRVQACFRGWRVRKVYWEEYFVQDIVAALQQQSRLLRGYLFLAFYLVYLSTFGALLVTQRNAIDGHNTVQYLHHFVQGVSAHKGGPFCPDAIEVLESIGYQFCENTTATASKEEEFRRLSSNASCSLGSTFSVNSVTSAEHAVDWIQALVLDVMAPPHFEPYHAETYSRLTYESNLYGHDLKKGFQKEYPDKNATELSDLYVQMELEHHRHGSGRLGLFNKLYAGVLVASNRKKWGDCRGDTLSGLAPYCRTSTTSTDVHASPFPPYNRSAVMKGACPPWHHVDSRIGFPQFFPSSHYIPRSESFTSFLTHSLRTFHFVDSMTQDVTALVVVFNPQVHLFGVLEVVFHFKPSGEITRDINVDIAKSGVGREIRLLMIVYLCCIVGLAGSIVYSVFKSGSFLIKHSARAGLLCDAACLVTQIYAMASYLTQVAAFQRFVGTMDEGVVADLPSLLQDQSSVQTADLVLPFLNQVVTAQLEVKEFAVQMNTYATVQGVALMVSVLRLLQHVEFQERLAVVTKTLQVAAIDLVHFLFIYITLLLFYAVLCTILFGLQVTRFTTVWESFHHTLPLEPRLL